MILSGQGARPAVYLPAEPFRICYLLEEYLARAAGDRVQEKVALDHLGLAHARAAHRRALQGVRLFRERQILAAR